MATAEYILPSSFNGKSSPSSPPPATIGFTASPIKNELKPEPIASEPKLDVPTLILQQMEYYLSDRNLVKDKYLREQLQKAGDEGYMPLEIFVAFPKLRKMSSDMNFIKDTIRSSLILELSPDTNMVRRRVPFVPPVKSKKNKATKSPSKSDSAESTNIARAGSPPPVTEPATPAGEPAVQVVITESKTIYVAHIPKGSDKSSIHNIFGVCGSITRIDIPVDKKSGDLKGTAFIEFETEEEARKAIEFFNDDENLFKQIGVQVRPYKMRSKTGLNGSADAPTEVGPVSPTKPMEVQTSPDRDNKKQRRRSIATSTAQLPSFGNFNTSPTKNILGQSAPQSAGRFGLSVEISDPKFVHFARRRSNPTTPVADDLWEPSKDDSFAKRRPRLFEAFEACAIQPFRQPKGPDGSKGFSAGRGRLIRV